MGLHGKKIIVAVTGSIAAYKIPHFVRLLVKQGAEVRVITTKAAETLVSPLALATVSKNPVLSAISSQDVWNSHVELGLWADLMVVAPCSANTLAKLAHGICDNLLVAVYLSARCPVFLAPAMDEDMWHHPSTKLNLERLRQYGNFILPVGNGELASGLIGEGRMAEPEEMVTYLHAHFAPKAGAGLKALVTAGPTYEKLDPVRFIGNYSSGKMGIALADALADVGMDVVLVLGPSSLMPKNQRVKVEKVESAQQMHDACIAHISSADIAIMAAAVADYKPEQMTQGKMKKTGGPLTLQLVQTPDILKELGRIRPARTTLVGFALETDHELENARKKLESKNADLIVLNSMNDAGAGFGSDTNKVTLVGRNNVNLSLPIADKTVVAKRIVEYIIEMRNV